MTSESEVIAPRRARAQCAPRRIAVFHDSCEFGGHERAFLAWLPGLLASDNVGELTVSYCGRNQSLTSALREQAHPKLKPVPGPFRKWRAAPYLAPARLTYQHHARALVERTGADLALLLQGRIENTLPALLALWPRIETVSYLPMAHSLGEMASRWNAGQLGDRVRRLYYALPARFIVPSEAVAQQLRAAGARAPVRVVKNAVPAPEPLTRAAARRGLGLAPNTKLALYMGRFEAHQKGLDRLLDALEHAADDLSDFQVWFVGDGPARPALAAACARLAGRVQARVLPWTDRPCALLRAADVLLLPSRFEGVPLVLLEALACGLPILASDIDVHREYLPPAHLCSFGPNAALGCRLRALLQPASIERFAVHARAVADDSSLTRSRRAFERAVLGLPPD